MQQVLEQINSLPGVIGSFVREAGGKVVAHVFPPLFDSSIVQDASQSLADALTSLQECEGPESVDFRFAEGRVFVKPLADAQLVLLCTKDVNLQVLTISLNVAIKKIEKLLPAVETVPPAASQDQVAIVPPSRPVMPAADGGDELFLTVGQLAPAEANKGFEQLGMVAINQSTVHSISNHFGVGTIKKVKLGNQDNGKNGVFPLMVVNDDEGKYDGMLVLGRSIEKKLEAAVGSRLLVELA
ncbi:MAG TPA: roadblock/LC7 domain-containing protein [Geobacteraceae bacterium]